jgi:hypothetical protein
MLRNARKAAATPLSRMSGTPPEGASGQKSADGTRRALCLRRKKQVIGPDLP